MVQFKKGDLVRRIEEARIYGIPGPYSGEPFRVSAVVRDTYVIDQWAGVHHPQNLELVETEEEKAEKLLTSLGYKIQPPPGKEKGQVVIYRWPESVNKSPKCVSKETWDNNFNYHESRTDLQLIAIVDWTEGDGI